jgi:predicted nucleic acid-binding protein
VKVLFDTNVVLDVLLAREPFVETAAQLLALVDAGRIEGSVCATTITIVHYLAAKSIGSARTKALLRELVAMFDVACVDRQVLARALDLDIADFEHAVLHEAARASGVTAIVTRDVRDFQAATIPVFEPSDLLAAVVAASEE